MNKTKELWLCLQDRDVVKLIAVKSLIEADKDITIKALLDSYKQFKLRLLIA